MSIVCHPAWPKFTAHQNSDAVFSENYRYVLWRRDSASLPPLTFIMLNPSRANKSEDDKTISMCRAFAHANNAGGIVVVNIFATISTDWRKLLHATDPAGPDNTRWVKEACDKSQNIVVAWGAMPRFRSHIDAMLCTLKGWEKQLLCLGVSKEGYPRHPSRLSLSSQLIKYIY